MLKAKVNTLTNEQRNAKLKALVIPTLRQREVANNAFYDNFYNLTDLTCVAFLEKCKAADIKVLMAWAEATKDINSGFYDCVFSGRLTTLCVSDINYLYSETMQ